MTTPDRLNRRRFLKLASGAVCGAAASCVGIGWVGLRQPKVDMITSSCVGGEGGRFLVTYASRAGSTAEIAEAMGEALCGMDRLVDVVPVTDVKSLDAYQAVVVGSAIYMGRWMPPAVSFLKEHSETLKRLPLAMFTVCLTLKDPTEENISTVAAYLDPVLDETALEPADVGLFAGRLKSENLSPLYRTMAKQMGGGDGDYRNWSAITTWAKTLPAKLTIA